MCGIYGGVGRPVIDSMEKALSELHHRGPDDRGSYCDERAHVGLGHTRLSIIDLSEHAHQPMASPCSNYVLVFNGEIYNYQDIKSELVKLGVSFATQSDTEVVLKSYETWGAGCLQKLRGMFAFCVYDKDKQKLFLARDRFGIKPLLYSLVDDQFVFSSELRPFLTTGLVEKSISTTGLTSLFEFGSVSQPDTIIDGIHSLMPGHYLEFDIATKSLSLSRYYALSSRSIEEKRDYDQIVADLRQELEEATRYHLVADVEVGAFLSGGVDSTAVVALMKKANEDASIKTFTVGFDAQRQVVDESEIAARSAKSLGTSHHSIIVDDSYIEELFDQYISDMDQPSLDGINSYIVCREAAKDVKVVLSGLGGDELYGGYAHFKDLPECARAARSWVTPFAEMVHRIRPNRFSRRYLFQGLPLERALSQLRRINNPALVLKNTRSQSASIAVTAQARSDLQRLSVHEFEHYLLNTLLRDCDALSMANSIEVRPILLDHKLVEQGFNLPDDAKVRNGSLKACFVDAIKDVVPSEVYSRKKTGFEMPFVKWMNGVLWQRFYSVLNDNVADKLLSEHFLNKLRKRANKKQFKRNDWLVFIVLSWMQHNKVQL